MYNWGTTTNYFDSTLHILIVTDSLEIQLAILRVNTVYLRYILFYCTLAFIFTQMEGVWLWYTRIKIYINFLVCHIYILDS